MTVTDVITNLKNAIKLWAHISRILGREGEDARMSGHFYVAVVHAKNKFGSETWVMTPRMEQTLGGFHHRVVRRLTGKLPKM